MDSVRMVGALGLVLVCAACSGRSTVTHGVAGSCVAPYLNDQPPDGPFQGPSATVAAGATITVYGHWYTSTCNDTGGDDPLEPLPPVHLSVTLPGGETEDLGEGRPGGPDMGFSAVVQVPARTQAGTATVSDGRHASYSFRIRSMAP